MHRPLTSGGYGYLGSPPSSSAARRGAGSLGPLACPTERLVAFYNKRGTAEQWIKEGKNAIKWTRLSCRRFRNNAVRLQLHALAYNLANLMRTLALPKETQHWSPTTLREKPVKIGAKVVAHGSDVTFQLAEGPVPRTVPRETPLPSVRPGAGKASGLKAAVLK